MLTDFVQLVSDYFSNIDNITYAVDIMIAGMFPLPFSIVSLFRRGAKGNGIPDPESYDKGEACFREMLESIEEGYYEIDREGVLLFYNTCLCRLFGYKKKELAGRNLFHFLSGDNRPAVKKVFDKVYRTSLPYTDLELEIKRRDGERRVLQTSVSVLRDISGNKIGLRGIARDITEKREREEALLLGERAMAASNNGIVITDPNQTDNPIIYCNTAFEKTTGYKRREVIGRGLTILYGPETDLRAAETIRKAVEAKEDCRVMIKNYRKNGSLFWNEIALSPVRDSEGKTTHFIVSQTDLTERVQGEYKLRENEERFRKLLENASDVVTVISEDGTILYESPAVERVLGYQKSKQRIGRNIFDYIHPEDLDRSRQAIDGFLKKPGSVEKMTVRFQHQDGTWHMIESIGHNLLQDPVIQGIVINSRDITERLKAEEALIESEQKLSLHIRQTPLAVIEWNTNMEVIDWNPSAERIFGFTSAEAVGRHAFELMIQEEQRAEMKDIWKKLLENKGSMRGLLSSSTKEGRRIYCEWYNTPLVAQTGVVIGVASLILDITNRIEAETSLRNSEERYRLFFEEDLTGDYLSAPDGTLLACNPAFAKIFGFPSVDAALRTNIYQLYPDGQIRKSLLVNLRKERKLDFHELELRRLDGKPVYIIENVVGAFDDAGELVEIKGYMFDNTERKRLERQLIQAQKMQSLGTLAAGVAHDFNNVLSILDGSLSLLRPNITDEGLHKYITMGEMAVQRGADVAGRLLTFARTEDLKLVPFRLDKVVQELTKVLNHTIDKKIIVDAEIPGDLPFIKGDQGQVYQMLLNMCINSRDALLDPDREETPGRISFSAVKVEGNSLIDKFPEASDQLYVKVSISDNGMGMSDTVRQRIFDPFFTTKPIGKGTGLGLSVVYGMVKSHQGFIEVESSTGVGTTFDIYLPALVVEQTAQPDCSSVAAARGSETILIVEDEEMMQTILSEMLKSHGYEVLQARDGVEGLTIFNQECDRIGAVILDMGLPRLSGQELFKRMKHMRENVKVIVASGFLEAELRESLYTAGIKAFVQKPYKTKDMLTIIRDVFDTAA